MKTLQLFLSLITGIISILFASSYVGFATAESTSILDSGMPPIIMTQVELWGPSSFHTDGVRSCENNETSLGPWAVGWVELHNTKNDSVAITDVDLQGKGWEEGQFPITLGPQEYCYIVTQNQLSTRIGVGGSLGNGPPPHDNATTILLYSVQSLDKKMNYTYSTPPLSDDLGDAKTWQLVDGNWIFLNANFRQDLSAKTIMLSPLKQFKSGIAANDVMCKQDLHLVIKLEDGSPACVKLQTAQMLVEQGWAKEIVSAQVNTAPNMKPIIQNYTGYQSKIIPGPLLLSSCGGGKNGYHSFSNILNSTGFHVFYNVMNSSIGIDDDYVIEPGHAGTITYVINAGSSPTPYMTNSYFQKELDITNYAVFYHYVTDYEELLHNPSVTIHNGDYESCFKRPNGSCAGLSGPITGPIHASVVDHPGVNVSFDPTSELLQYNDTSKGKSSQIITMTVSADYNTPQGTYWTVLSPEECLGGKIFLLTIGSESYPELKK